MIQVRNLLPFETLESRVVTGFEPLPLDQDWVWNAIGDEGVIVGQLICAPVHGAVLMLRLVVSKEAPTGTARALLRVMFRDTRARGYLGYLTMLGSTRPAEGRMLKILRRLGGQVLTEPFVLVCGESPVVR